MPARWSWLHGFRASQCSPGLVNNAASWPAPGTWPTLRYPGRVPGGVMRDDPVESIDVPATLLSAAGLDLAADPIHAQSPARSFWLAACDGAATPRTLSYSEGRTGA